MMDKLLPCPFCGGEAKLKTARESDGQISYDSIYVVCLNCRSTGLSYTTYYNVSSNPEEEAVAAWNRRVDARQFALKTGVCPMCEDCPDGCPVETPKDSRNIITNADRIRSMSDEELAEYIFDLGNGSEYCYGHCLYQSNDDLCKKHSARGLKHTGCIQGVIGWLTRAKTEDNS